MLNTTFDSNFWKLYGTRIKIYAILTVVIIAVVQYWHHHKNHANKLAAQKFNMALVAMSANDFLTAKNHNKELLKYSDSTPYPKLAALMLAKIFVQEDNLAAAISTLQTVVDKKSKDNIWHIANLRLIKVLLLANQPKEAQNYLALGIKDQKFSSLYYERQGDIFLAKEELNQANNSYHKAVKALPEQTHAAWLDLKIADTNKN
jgi:predicted negative regulator of RcsB-dependent stress response